MNPQRFLKSSPDNRVSPRASPNQHISNGPLNKVSELDCHRFSPSFLLDAFWDTFIFPDLRFVLKSACVSPSVSLPHRPSRPSSSNPPPSLLSLPRQKSLPAMRRPSNRAATCTSTTFHRSDTNTHRHFSCSCLLRPWEYFQFFKSLNLINCLFRFPRQPASKWMTCLTFS